MYTHAMLILIFNTYRTLFLGLQKVWMVKLTPCQIPNTSKIFHSPTGRIRLPITTIWETLVFASDN